VGFIDGKTNKNIKGRINHAGNNKDQARLYGANAVNIGIEKSKNRETKPKDKLEAKSPKPYPIFSLTPITT
jgi:hypothetical protein